MAHSDYQYRGDGAKPVKPQSKAWDTPEPYQPSKELIRAVNLSIYLQRPLLLEGEAGCGKSRLAYAVAYELGLPLFVWPVRSSSKAEEGLYHYDAMLRLHDVQLGKQGQATGPRDPSQPVDYRRLGKLGEAFDLTESPGVVLIDEIDKADLDFPNDLLGVLEEPRQFTIAETGETIKAAHPPIVIITSNKEKGNLPAPFLRRCLYHFIKFPEDKDTLETIIRLHLKQEELVAPEKIEAGKDLITKAAGLFLKIRKAGVAKPPSTSELLDWVRCLLEFEDQPSSAGQLPDEPGKDLPYLEVLYKLRTDWERLVPNA